LGIALHEIFFGKRPVERASNGTEGYSKRPAPLTSTPIARAMLSLCESCLAEIPVERPANANAVGRLFEAARRRLRVPKLLSGRPAGP